MCIAQHAGYRDSYEVRYQKNRKGGCRHAIIENERICGIKRTEDKIAFLHTGLRPEKGIGISRKIIELFSTAEKGGQYG